MSKSPLELIDTHTHLERLFVRGELEAALARAKEAGVTRMVTIGTGSDDWGLYRSLAERYPGTVHYTVGLHPCSVGERWTEETAQIEAFFTESRGVVPVALGECGLDRFHLPKDDPETAERILSWQKAAFAAQLELARRLGCPVMVHSRGAFAESVAMIDASGVAWERVVFHCFTEGPEEVAQLVERGGRASFTGVITYKNADTVRAALRRQGADKLMLETDAPYLAPTPHRGKDNEPAWVRYTAEAAAKELGVSYAEVAAKTTANAREFLRI